MTRPTLPWVTYSKLLIAAMLLGMPATDVHAGKFPGADEVLSAVYPDSVAERETILLTEAELKQVADLAGQKEPRALVTRYVARRDGEVAGYAYLDKHLVRTLPEILMISLGRDGALRRIDVMAFQEPPDYMAPEPWLRQFDGMRAEDEIRLKKNIDGITGATLTARATTQAARRVLAVHKVLEARTP